MQDEWLYAICRKNGKSIPCVVLASFLMEQSIREIRRFLFFKWERERKRKQRFFLVFLPWKHREKELALLPAEAVTVTAGTPRGFVRVARFVSHFTEEWPYAADFVIENFHGLALVFETGDFIANVYEQCVERPLSVLYAAYPSILELASEDDGD